MKQIQDLDSRPQLVIMITGYSDVTGEEAKKLGADVLLSKPFKREELLNAITSRLKA